VFAQYVSVLGSVEDDIVDCFRNGGGVPYSRFPRFHAVMAEDSGQSVLSSLESHIVPLVPALADRLSEGIDVLDVGCGAGRIMNRLAALYPNSCFTGIDLSDEAVTTARNAAAEGGLSNIEFITRDLSDFDEAATPDAYDLITTFDAVHDQAKPLSVLPDAGHQRYRTRPQGRRASHRDTAVHHFHDALHDGVTGPGRGRVGRHVG
jgi:2-polyprenyl-3-methyl-5-hydroxy-6-metoxy-1,4-benzoquinol methylase